MHSMAQCSMKLLDWSCLGQLSQVQYPTARSKDLGSIAWHASLCLETYRDHAPTRIYFEMHVSRTVGILFCSFCRGKTATAFAMNEDFSRTLDKQMDLFNSPDGDQVNIRTECTMDKHG